MGLCLILLNPQRHALPISQIRSRPMQTELSNRHVLCEITKNLSQVFPSQVFSVSGNTFNIIRKLSLQRRETLIYSRKIIFSGIQIAVFIFILGWSTMKTKHSSIRKVIHCKIWSSLIHSCWCNTHVELQ